ncbi:6-O-methylguanine DNA methyltransferase, partial [Kalaharituber pfeilii]
FTERVYMAVQEIPYGKVTTYGHIARLICERKQSEQVGQALKYLPVPGIAEFHHDNVPWQRVISSTGVIPRRDDPSGARRQALRLRAEGVQVTEANGEFLIELNSDFGWFPARLPSEEAG